MMQNGIDFLTLDSPLNAVNFYHRLGFIDAGQGKFITQNGTNLDSVQMIKYLTNSH
ncbi:GNAT family N-acetyltransferase [Thalassotalea litorea]|uniref:GNAT family N-acetyltransferase n=1 Tax=Thalassotalea litorea TaxID=2020715 RepID=A0A5R9IRL1_9GAMM|nr:GNAT family N-acetyltransferase [Thalassotalea litorea]TLU67113.1 GNAT family N-acetyltransferase [Thalassotalea litorea]